MAAAASLMEPIFDADKLNYQIFSALESLFLFGRDDPRLSSLPPPPAKPHAAVSMAGGRVRILSIDAADGAGVFAAACLARLESSLRSRSGDPAARISDFFDVAAGSGAGGFLAALLFTRGPDGAPPLSAEEALALLADNRREISGSGSGRRRMMKGMLRAAFGRRQRSEGVFRRALGDATLRDTVKPVLIPCYDLATGAPFVFSRADAMEAEGFDFRMSDVCAAACSDPGAGAPPSEIASVDGRTRISAVGGGLALGNPAAAAVTHVMNNRREFPRVSGVEDLLVVSFGGAGEASDVPPASPPSRAQFLRIAGRGDADLVDQSLGMSFGQSGVTNNYVRIQASGINNSEGSRTATLAGGGGGDPAMVVEEVLAERNVESVLLRGRRLSEQTNGEKLDWFSGELVKEHDRRITAAAGECVAFVAIKQAATPRTSSATTDTTASSPSSSSSSVASESPR